jgi:uncharacterized protein (UPF0254 family)
MAAMMMIAAAVVIALVHIDAPAPSGTDVDAQAFIHEPDTAQTDVFAHGILRHHTAGQTQQKQGESEVKA